MTTAALAAIRPPYSMRQVERHALMTILVLLWALVGVAQADTRHVLLLTSTDRPFAPQSGFSDTLRPELIRESHEPIDLVEVAVQTARENRNTTDPALADRLQSTLGGQHLDLVITVGGPAALFAQQFRQRLFPATPLLVAGVDRRFVQESRLTDRDALVATEHNAAPIIDEIIQLLPDTRRIVVVIGASALEHFWLQQLKHDFARFEGRLEFVWTNELSLAQIVDTARRLPPHSAIFFALMSMDANGEPIEGGKAFASIQAAANAPIFALFAKYLGQGVVGGRLQTLNELSRQTVDDALRILRGEPPHVLRTAIEQIGEPSYDWRQLRRWNIPETRLPAGSTVLFREPTVWQRYKTPFLAGATLAGVPGMIAIALVLGRLKRRSLASVDTAALQPGTERATVPTIRVWTADLDGRRVETNHFDEGASLHRATMHVDPEDLDQCLDMYRRAIERRESFQLQYRVLRDDGGVRWVVDTGVPRVVDGRVVGYVGSAVDITPLANARKELSTLSRHLIASHEREREAISKKLHDDLCQRMVLLTVRLHEASVARDDIDLHDIHQELSRLAGEFLTVADGAARRLEILGLVRMCRNLCREVAANHGVDIQFHDDSVPAEVSSEIALAVYRVVEEALANAVTHPGGGHVRVTLHGTVAELRLDIADDSTASEGDTNQRNSVGLTAIRERVALVSGKCSIVSRPGAGTHYHVSVPVRTRV